MKKRIVLIALIVISHGINAQNKIESTGNIGIGTLTPTKLLDVQNAFSGAGEVYIWIKKSIDGTNNNREAGLLIGTNAGDYGNNFKIVAKSPNAYFGSPTLNFDFIKPAGQGTINLLTIKDTGNVGIGTSNPGTWKLAVNGQIRAKEIKVETGWSDFVFYDDYKLPTLKQVENHIKEEGHLKDIPSAKEVQKNGIFLGEMDSKLLQKIEELTLYTIQQQKEIDALKKEKEEFKSINTKLLELQKRLEKLEK